MRALLFLFVLVAGVVSASADPVGAYTVQVAAFRESAPASALVATLQLEGFAAYLDATTLAGQRVARVRVGCFGDAVSAEGIASALRVAYGHHAWVAGLERQPGTACVTRELGFLLPVDANAWGVAAQSAQMVVFWAQVGAERGYLAFDQGGWRVVQREVFERERTAVQAAAANAAQQEIMPTRVRAHLLHGVEVVLFEDRVLAAGRLLWHSAQAIVINDGHSVVALRLEGAR